jgi:alkanesulfonate monooxygenase SsuD/methylene tetrahydromethanopterin reductase-like flavin-dependent oxidoreductase (luciferase family)
MRIGYHLTPFWSPTDRDPSAILDQAIEVVGATAHMGFEWVSMGQHWLSHPTVWPAPIPFLARLAPETGNMRIKTSVLLLPLLNAVEVAEDVATLDHLTHGRLTVGVSIGYREAELHVAGLTRHDRVPKLEESLELMKRLWSGEEVTFEGRYQRVRAGRMGLLPVQKPHPPIEFGAQSAGATRRAARVGDGVFFGPQVGWDDIRQLASEYRLTCVSGGRAPGTIGASRALLVGRDKEDAAGRARQYLEKTFAMYSRWSMQEQGMAPLTLDFTRSLDEWTIHGSPADCVSMLLRARDELGLDGVGFTIYSLPPSPSARIEYLHMIAQEIVAPVVAHECQTSGTTSSS